MLIYENTLFTLVDSRYNVGRPLCKTIVSFSHYQYNQFSAHKTNNPYFISLIYLQQFPHNIINYTKKKALKVTVELTINQKALKNTNKCEIDHKA